MKLSSYFHWTNSTEAAIRVRTTTWLEREMILVHLYEVPTWLRLGQWEEEGSQAGPKVKMWVKRLVHLVAWISSLEEQRGGGRDLLLAAAEHCGVLTSLVWINHLSKEVTRWPRGPGGEMNWGHFCWNCGRCWKWEWQGSDMGECVGLLLSTLAL